MRVLASILTLYFGLLMLQPFYGMGLATAKLKKSCGTEKCCRKQANNKPAAPCNGATNCNMDFCNPFVPCGVNITPRAVLIAFENRIIELSEKKKPTINEDIPSDYLADCWRPPRLS